MTEVDVMVTYSLSLYKPFRVVTTGAQHDGKKVEKKVKYKRWDNIFDYRKGGNEERRHRVTEKEWDVTIDREDKYLFTGQE